MKERVTELVAMWNSVTVADHEAFAEGVISPHVNSLLELWAAGNIVALKDGLYDIAEYITSDIECELINRVHSLIA